MKIYFTLRKEKNLDFSRIIIELLSANIVSGVSFVTEVYQSE